MIEASCHRRLCSKDTWSGVTPDLDLLASFPHDLHHENEASSRQKITMENIGDEDMVLYYQVDYI
jgi:hypothetical protein